jgi:hypothetical protein
VGRRQKGVVLVTGLMHNSDVSFLLARVDEDMKIVSQTELGCTMACMSEWGESSVGGGSVACAGHGSMQLSADGCIIDGCVHGCTTDTRAVRLCAWPEEGAVI